MYLDGDTIYVSPEEDNTIIYANEDSSEMFIGYNGISLDLSNFNTSNVTDMYQMFYNCTSLTSIDLSNFDTSKVTDMERMFNSSSNLSGNITIMNPNITNYDYMFSGCSTTSGTKFIVNYNEGCKEVAQAMVNTKSSKSNVVLGTQV